MDLSEMRAHLIQKINTIDDEATLSILEEAIGFYTPDSKRDVTDGLATYQLEELKTIMEEPAEKNTISEKDFQNLFSRWRTK